MTSKMVDGTVASYLMDAIKHATELTAAVNNMQTDLCFRGQPPGAWAARKAGRAVMQALVMIDHCVQEKGEEPVKKIEIVK